MRRVIVRLLSSSSTYSLARGTSTSACGAALVRREARFCVCNRYVMLYRLSRNSYDSVRLVREYCRSGITAITAIIGARRCNRRTGILAACEVKSRGLGGLPAELLSFGADYRNPVRFKPLAFKKKAELCVNKSPISQPTTSEACIILLIAPKASGLRVKYC